ncbi:MAG: putative toxin-antitoxin system toxin component, PIN family [Acidobacteria bacterium]|nr:putative toxin-antitoxin system toxin component, PIN family [Acidobacteriota bacterium]MCW5968546.1 putative toxin-antitoxin system toxin component, PIN family [Blastocatellales bacterium]
MSTEKPRIVLDCVVCLQAAAKEKSPAAACLRLAENHHLQLFISRAIIKEIQDVLSRDYVRARFKTLTDASVNAFIERLHQSSELIRDVPRHFNYERRDVKDEPYINLAVEVEAHYLVSRDNDLLDLMKWEKEEGREFQKRFRGLKITTPEKFLAEISNKGKADE